MTTSMRKPRPRRRALPDNVIELRPKKRDPDPVTLGQIVDLATAVPQARIPMAIAVAAVNAICAVEAGDNSQMLGCMAFAGALATRFVFHLNEVPRDRGHVLGHVEIGGMR
jgi:hypothetical protein